jgi:methionyl-tRNA formyltransferase
MKPLDLVFMGTPEFSVPSLRRLVADGHRVSLVISQPDRPRGRGRRTPPTPVKTAAEELNLPVLQPASVNTPEVLERIRASRPEAVVVIAFGQILKPALLELPPLGCINVHGSRLPRYRGPAPIAWAIINGETRTGITTMRMDKGLDTGPLLLERAIPIRGEDSADTLHDRLAELGAEVLAETLVGLGAGTLIPQPQDHALATYAPMLKKTDGLMDWSKPARVLERFIRGMTSWPGAFSFRGQERIKFFRALPVASHSAEPPGTVVSRFPGEVVVQTGEGGLSVLELQAASSKRLPVEVFLQGHALPPGSRFRDAPETAHA